jgi:hypothetical protein
VATTELDVFILRNLADLDATALRLEKIDANIWKEVDAAVEQWALKNGWLGSFDVEGSGLWVTPAGWSAASEDEDDPDASFHFEVATRDPPTFFDLSDLCGLGGSRYGFRFHQSLVGKMEWRELARNNINQFQSLGMHLDSKASPFVDVTISSESLAIAVQAGDFGEALEPITRALDRFAGAEKVLSSMLFKAGGASKSQPAAKKMKARKSPSRRSK